jgi:hypothetical protein
MGMSAVPPPSFGTERAAGISFNIQATALIAEKAAAAQKATVWQSKAGQPTTGRYEAALKQGNSARSLTEGIQ